MTPDAKNLIIVESPTKAKTISDFVGKEYLVESSFGHIRDLPKSKLGIDVENNFEPQYIIPRKIQKKVTALKKIAQKAETIILATDEDREGEAIAWHLTYALGLNNQPQKSNSDHSDVFVPTSSRILDNIGINSDHIKRIVFHEITKEAIGDALKNPREINLNLVAAQQARRVLDRLVGYKLSPFLWKKIVRGLSAGRVQSVTLHLIARREAEINDFKADEYWTITALLKVKPGKLRRKVGSSTRPNLKDGVEVSEFEASLSKIDGEAIPKLGIKNKAEADKIVADLKNAEFEISKIDRKETRRNPYPPFTTSTLQQTASRYFGFSSKKTMVLAQQLYEQGHITYMRTDSLNLSNEAVNKAKIWIKDNLGKNYECETKHYKTKSRMAQEAHEAIRPTNPTLAPKEFESKISSKLDKDQQKVYDLIWRRFIASQLPTAIFDATKIEIGANSTLYPSGYTLVANGNILKFDGFLKCWPAKIEEKELPELAEKEKPGLKKLNPEQHFTEPPPRYNEASLIKILEENGIGRPSTYSPIISVILTRNYVEKIQGRFHLTEIGSMVDKVISENFPEIIDTGFTAKMEENLDEIAEGRKEWRKTIKEFYDPFSKHLEKKYEEVAKLEPEQEKTNEKCEKCGKEMIIKFGRFGKFMACSGFPECKNAKSLKNPPKEIGLKCPKCNGGQVVEKRVNRKGRARGKIFWGCSRYPDCDYASWTNPLEPKEEKAPKTETPKKKKIPKKISKKKQDLDTTNS